MTVAIRPTMNAAAVRKVPYFSKDWPVVGSVKLTCAEYSMRRFAGITRTRYGMPSRSKIYGSGVRVVQ